MRIQTYTEKEQVNLGAQPRMWASLSLDIPMMRILIRPKIVMLLLLIALFFLILNWLKMPKTSVTYGTEHHVRAYVTLNGIERVVPFHKGETVQKLRFLIMSTFSELGLDRYPAGCLKILEKKGTSGKYVALPIRLKLKSDLVVTLQLPKTPQEKEKCIRLVSSNNAPPQGPIAFHPINPNRPYRFWSLVFGASRFLRRGPNNIVDCKGNFMDPNTIMTSVTTRESFAFIFKDTSSGNEYVLTAANESTLVAKEFIHPTPKDLTNAMRFIPFYYWSFTLFKNVNMTTLYLACDVSGEASMVPMKSFRYPDTRALFITNDYHSTIPLSSQ